MIGQNLADVESVKRSRLVYEYIIKNYSTTIYAEQSQFALALQCYFGGNRECAKTLFITYLQRFPNGNDTDLASEILKKLQ